MQLASPALAVKRHLRGPSVLEQQFERKTLEETMVALDAGWRQLQKEARLYKSAPLVYLRSARSSCISIISPFLFLDVSVVYLKVYDASLVTCSYNPWLS